MRGLALAAILSFSLSAQTPPLAFGAASIKLDQDSRTVRQPLKFLIAQADNQVP